MGCESQIKESFIIQQLLQNDATDFALTRIKLSWLSTSDCFTIESPVKSSQKSYVANKNNNRNNQNRYFFGYKSQNKINNFQFRFFNDKESYVEQYRKEHKNVPCLSSLIEEKENAKDNKNWKKYRLEPEVELYETSIPVDVNSIATNDCSNQKSVENSHSTEPSSNNTEKSIIHQIRFWQKQNPSSSPNQQTSNVPTETYIAQEEIKSFDGTQIHGSNKYLVNNGNSTSLNHQNGFSSGNRLSVHNKRSLDVIIPQGTTYDILTEENRLNGLTSESDRVNSKEVVSASQKVLVQDNLGPMKCSGLLSRENSKIRKVGGKREGGTIEFAKLLDEKLCVLFEQEQRLEQLQRYQKEILERNSSLYSFDDSMKTNTGAKSKNYMRIKSASHSVTSYTSNTLSNLAVSGISTGTSNNLSRCNTKHKQRLSEDKNSKITIQPQCLLPQMPAFGMQYFPKCIVPSSPTPLSGKADCNSHNFTAHTNHR